VFNDLQTELQRSLGFFTNLDRTAKIGRVVAMGNAFKLPGLRRYLAQSLGFEIERVETFRGLAGPEVLATPALKDNILSFGVCYGLCLQALGRAGLRTNLLPKEITMDRLIRRKKPWAVAAAALVMLACTISFAAHSMQVATVKEQPLWKPLENRASDVDRQSHTLMTEEEEALTKFKATKDHGDHLVNNLEGRKHWLEFLAAISKCLPKDDQPMPSTTDPPAEIKNKIMHRNQMLVTNLDSQQMEDVGKWFAAVKGWYLPVPGSPGAPPVGDSSPDAAPGGAPVPGGEAAAGGGAGPSGPGLIVQIYGKHYHNADDEPDGSTYVRQTLIKELASERMHAMGVSYPVLIMPEPISPEEVVIPSPKRRDGDDSRPGAPRMGGGMTMGGGDTGVSAEKRVQVRKFSFRVQFVWQPKSATEQAAPPAAAPPAAAATAVPVAAGPTAAPVAVKPAGPPEHMPAAAGPSAAPPAAVSPAPGPGPAPGTGLAPSATGAPGSTPKKP
jgi:type IV pilus assembly protein PilM